MGWNALEHGQNLFGVVLRLYFGKDMQQPLAGAGIRADDKGSSFYAFNQLSVHALRPEQVVTIDKRHVRVGEQVVGKVVLSLEVLLGLHIIARDAEDHDASLLQLLEGVAKSAGFDGAAGRIGARVEEENDRFIGEIGEIDGLAVLVLEREVFDFVVDLHVFL